MAYSQGFSVVKLGVNTVKGSLFKNIANLVVGCNIREVEIHHRDGDIMPGQLESLSEALFNSPEVYFYFLYLS